MTGPEGGKSRGWRRFTAIGAPKRVEFDDGFALAPPRCNTALVPRHQDGGAADRRAGGPCPESVRGLELWSESATAATTTDHAEFGEITIEKSSLT
jgi:hypothetical protein